MTPTSLVPEQAAHMGMSYQQTVPLDRGGRLMRSVKAQRKSRGAVRTKPNRRGESAKRPPAERVVLGKKKTPRDGFFTRIRESLPAVGLPRRPMLHLTWLLLLAAFVAALFAGGYIGRCVQIRGPRYQCGDRRRRLRHFVRASRRQWPHTAFRDPGGAGFRTRPDRSSARTCRPRGSGCCSFPGSPTRKSVANIRISIAVSLVEKLPFALWQMPAGTFVVERSGRVIIKTDASAFPHLPVFMGDGAPDAAAELVDAIAQRRAIAARVKAYATCLRPALESSLDDGVVVELPETGWQKQLDELEHLIVDKGVLERDITEIDLRSSDDFFFQLKNGDKQQMTRGNAT